MVANSQKGEKGLRAKERRELCEVMETSLCVCSGGYATVYICQMSSNYTLKIGEF